MPSRKKSIFKRGNKSSIEKKTGIASVKVVKKIPKGFRKTIGATTAPNGFELFDNGESLFSGKRKHVLVKIPDRSN